jgi:hypothetical protein
MMMLSDVQNAFLERCRNRQFAPSSPPVTPPDPLPVTPPVTPPGLPVEPLPSKQVSAMARDQFGMWAIKGQLRDVLDIVVAAHRNGVPDLSGREIQARFRQIHPGKDIDTGTVSARVNSLIAAKLLERCPDRLCSITSKTVGPVRPVAHQARMVA